VVGSASPDEPEEDGVSRTTLSAELSDAQRKTALYVFGGPRALATDDGLEFRDPLGQRARWYDGDGPTPEDGR
jgi:hypothetical protein